MGHGRRARAWLGLLAASAVILIAGAELFTENVGAAARRLGITVVGAALLMAGRSLRR